eukprot:42933_1
MGNKVSPAKAKVAQPSSKQETNTLNMYQDLINMGFNETIAMKAAKKFPNDLNQAIDCIGKSNTKITKEINIDNAHNDDEDQKNEYDILDDADNQHKSIQYDHTCSDIQTCEALNRLIIALQFHQMYKTKEKDHIDKICEYFMTNKHYIINDYHHILQYHLNEDHMSQQYQHKEFKLIHDRITQKNNNLTCDVNKCGAYIRNNRQREHDWKDKGNKINDKSVLSYINVLDSIHCHFLHSIDVGYRIIEELATDENNNDNMNDVNICSDNQLFILKSYLESKRKKLQNIRGTDRIQNNKFMTQLSTTNKINSNSVNEHKIQQNEDDKENENKNNESVGTIHEYLTELKSTFDTIKHKPKKKKKKPEPDYSFGIRYDYWGHGDECGFDCKYVKPKYNCLKDELMKNTIYCLDMNVFYDVYEKGKDLMNTSHIIKSLLCEYNHKKYGYKINIGTPLTLNHILSVL